MKKTLLSITLLASTLVNAQMPDGIDSTFGVNGYAITIPTANGIQAGWYSVGINDNVLGIGTTGGSNNNIYALKWDKDGKPVNGFGTSGLAMYDPKLGADDHGLSIVELASGKFLVAGTTDGNTSRDVLLMRINADGTIDNTFGNNGYITYNVKDDDYIGEMKVANNLIYLGGYNKVNGTITDAFIICTKMDGSLEQSFGTMGIAMLDPNNGDKETFSKLMIASSGSIYVIGKTQGQKSKQFLCKLKNDGTVDTSFADKGFFLYTEAGSTVFRDVIYDGAGSLFLCGSYDLNNDDLGFLMKLDTNGVMSTSFGSGNGKVVLNQGAGQSQVFFDMLLLDNNDIFIVGAHRKNGNPFNGLTVLYKSDGTLNTDYEQKGYKIASLPQSYLQMYYTTVLKQQSGQLILGGVVANANTQAAFSCRLKKYVPISSVNGAVSNDNSVTLYPNPTSGTIMLNKKANEVEQVLIYDASGALVENLKHINKYTFSNSTANGLYYIRVNTTKGVSTKTLILKR